MGVGSSGSSLSWIKTYPDIMMLPANRDYIFLKWRTDLLVLSNLLKEKCLRNGVACQQNTFVFFIKRNFQLTLKLRVSAGCQRDVPEHAGSGGGA